MVGSSIVKNKARKMDRIVGDVNLKQYPGKVVHLEEESFSSISEKIKVSITEVMERCKR